MTLQTKIETILTKYFCQPQDIKPDATLADMGLRAEVDVLCLQCYVEEEILCREFKDPAAIHSDMTVADLVALVEPLVERQGEG